MKDTLLWDSVFHLNHVKSPILTLSVGELLSESVGCDDQHPLDPPEQYHIIALQLEKTCRHTVLLFTY